MATFIELCNMSSWMTGEFLSSNRFPSFLWKIPTLLESNPVNSILMSYLIAASRPDIHENSLSRLSFLCDNDASNNNGVKKNYNKMAKKIFSYNPFRNNRCSLFGMEDTQLALRNLEQTLTDASMEKGEITNIFEVASEVLKCSIVVYESGESNVKRYRLYPFEDNLNGFGRSRRLYIFQNTSKEISIDFVRTKNSFSYGITPENAFSLRKQALIHILKTAEISDNDIKKLQEIISYNENFLITLLKNLCKDIIYRIFDFPYIAVKLSEAGFNTDPLKTDEKELSAFFYCMNYPDISILKLLYNHAVNNLQLSDSNVRSPKHDILNNLKKIQITLKHDLLRSRNYSVLQIKRKLNALKIYLQLLSFNKYQIDIVEDMIGIPEKNPREVMIIILDNYCKYFYIDSTSSTDNLNAFKHYSMFNEYYKFLDTFTCLLFFDHFISLSSFIKKENLNVYINAMSSILLCVLSETMFPKFRHGSHCENCKLDEYICEEMLNQHRLIPFCYRREFLRNAKELKQELSISLLEPIPEPKNDKPKCIKKRQKSIDIARCSLTALPDISENFISNRITNYLSSVKKISVQGDTVKNMLIAERLLQVLGEVLQNETKSEYHVKHLTCSLFSKDLEHQMCQLRDHCLSKYRASSIQGRLLFERNSQNFEKIQEELREISRLFLPIHASQLYRTAKYMIEHVKEVLSCQFSDMEGNLDNESEQVLCLQRMEFHKHGDKFNNLTRNMINYIRNMLINDDKLVTEKLKSYFNTLIFLFETIAMHCDVEFSAFLKDISKTIKHLFIQLENERLNPDMIDNCKGILSTCLPKFSNSNAEISKPLRFSFLRELLTDIYQANVFTKEEEDCVRQEIIKYLQNSRDAIHYLQTQSTIFPQILEKKLNSIVMTDKERKYINRNFANCHYKALECLKSIENLDECNNLENEDNLTATLITLSEKEKYRTMLFRIRFSHGLRKKIYQIMNQKIYFLINRINKLEAILIKEDEHVSYLWNRGKSESVRKHAKLLMSQRYIKERDTRAAVEMLLFDCWNTLKRDDLKELWEKVTFLFSGVDLRDILAHGNPVLEIIGGILDPTDLPSAMIDKIVELIDDRAALSALSEFWYRRKLSKFGHFINAINENVSKEDSSLCVKIKSCTRWQKYVELLPMER